MASDFVLRASNLEGIAEKVYGVSKSFDGHNQRITNAISRLNTQRSDGISKIVFALQGIQRDLRWGNRNLSN
ncbi:MAG: hypothetical protein FWG64_06435, partial [Firmicutes bacterium]|nr:hypothetical protein [Bacillota bacterium]